MFETSRTRAGENYYTESEEKKLWAHLRRLKDHLGERDFALMKTMRLLGLRRVETIRLNVGDVWRKTRLMVTTRIAAKGCTGELDIPVELQGILEAFCKLKRQWGEDLSDDAPLFVSRNGGRLCVRAVNDLVAKRNTEAGITSRITPHGSRHTKAQRIMRDDRYLPPEMKANAMALAQKQLRHKSITSTAIYTAPTREEMAQVAGI